jgi:hypothetical protein
VISGPPVNFINFTAQFPPSPTEVGLGKEKGRELIGTTKVVP